MLEVGVVVEVVIVAAAVEVKVKVEDVEWIILLVVAYKSDISCPRVLFIHNPNGREVSLSQFENECNSFFYWEIMKYFDSLCLLMTSIYPVM